MKKYELKYFEGVKLDVRDAKAWYKQQQEGLEKQFAASIREAIATLSQAPLAYAIRYRDVRICHTKRFPYNIHFMVDDVSNTITIVAIIHGSRKPGLTCDRLP